MRGGFVVLPSIMLATTIERICLREKVYLHDGSAFDAHTLGRCLGLARNHGLDLCRQILLPVLCAAPAVGRYERVHLSQSSAFVGRLHSMLI